MLLKRDQYTYGSWYRAKSRCLNKKDPKYKDYGGRGIKFCKRWLLFSNFLKDMGTRPPGKTLGRINNERGYGAQNCRWETNYQQSRNKRNNVVASKALKDLKRPKYLSIRALYARVERGMTVEEACTTPKVMAKMIRYKGKSLTINEWAKLSPVSWRSFRQRLDRGLTFKQALTRPRHEKKK